MEPVIVFSSIAAAFFGGLASAYWLTSRRTKQTDLPAIGCSVRIRSTAAMYRSKLVAIDSKGWRLSAPLSRDAHVPLRVGEELTIEAPGQECVYVFRTRIISRDAAAYEFTIAPPDQLRPQNRRDDLRIETSESVLADGEDARIVNLSPLGARFKTDANFQRGERIRLEFHDRLMHAWVLDVWPIRGIEEYRDEVRVRFEEVMDFSA